MDLFTLSETLADVGHYSGPNISLHIGFYRPRFRWVDAFRTERRAIADAIAQSPCEIVHAHWTYEFALPAIRSGKPSLVTVRDWAPRVLRHQRHPYRLVRLLMQRAVLRNAPALSANSPYIADQVRKHFGRNIPVIPNGVPIPETTPTHTPHPGFRIGALNSGFGRLKNVGTLIEAFAIVKQHVPDATLQLAGTDFETNGPAATWARERQLSQGVEFIGPLQHLDVREFMQSLDLFVHPSLEESFGSVLIEAMVNNTAVIGGADSGAVAWVLDHGNAGHLVDITSPEAIATETVKLANNRELLQQTASRGREHVLQEFSIDTVVNQYLTLLQEQHTQQQPLSTHTRR